jgi:RNA polymerase sigma-70 factor (ECF subfamily)
MQNKPNFPDDQMNVTSTITKDYENKSNWKLGKNKPNTKPLKANLLDTQMNVTAVNTMNNELRTMNYFMQYKPNQTQFKSERRSEKWNVSYSSSDLYYRIMRKSRDQIYDELLVVKCQQGDSQAFNELVGRWQKRLWHYAFKVTGSEPAAWDIVQETWYGIIKGIRKLEDVSVFPGWAFRIANNKCADWLRKQRLQNRLNNELTKRTKNESNKKQNSDEKTESLRAALEKLSPDRRALLTLRYHEGFDIGQIAEILDIPAGTVKSRLHRTVARLRQIMG